MALISTKSFVSRKAKYFFHLKQLEAEISVKRGSSDGMAHLVMADDHHELDTPILSSTISPKIETPCIL